MSRLRRVWHTMGWRLPLAVLGLLSLMVVGSLMQGVSSPQSMPLPDRSVYSTGPTGYRAWHLLAQKIGLPVRLWEQSFSELSGLETAHTMVMVAPYTMATMTGSGDRMVFGPKEAEQLLVWVMRGHTLILLDDFERAGSREVLRRLGLRVEGVVSTRDAASPAPVALVGGHRLLGSYLRQPLWTQARNRLVIGARRFHSPVHVLLQDAQGRPVLAGARYGLGRVIVGTAVDLGSNRYLHAPPENDNHQFLTNLLIVEQRPVLVNEFVHGYEATRNVFAYYREHTPLGQMVVHLLVGFWFLWWLSAVRWRPPRAIAGGHAPGASEDTGTYAFVDSMAISYARQQAGVLTLAPQLSQIEQLLARRYRMSLVQEGRVRQLLDRLDGGVSMKGDDEGSPQALAEALTEAQRAVAAQSRLAHAQVLRLSRQLTRIQERLQEGERDGAR